MATLRPRWLLSILLFSLPHCFAKAGTPAPPSDPECFTACDENTCEVDIHCTWDPRLDPQIPSNYSLHWETLNNEKGYVISETGWNGFIHREHFSSNEELRVWVEAKNQQGSAKSGQVAFDPADIMKPPPPNITLSHQEPLEIEWRSFCNQPHLSMGSCEVQYRIEGNQNWLQPDSGIQSSYTLENPQSCTVYEFRVRCACHKGKTSDWSKVRILSETAPVGKLDLWKDCGFSSKGFDCVLTWKKLPISQACGPIMGYEVTWSYNNGTVLQMNVSAEGSNSQLVCDGMQYYLKATSLKDVSSVNVSAYNAHGATVPAYLAMPVPGISCPNCHKSKEKDDHRIDVTLDKEKLTVSWNLTSHLSCNLNENVVQYKQLGRPPGQGFNWIKVNKNQTAFFKGQFHKITPYNVSVFTVSQSREVHHLSSLIVYSFEGTPPRVPSFRVLSIAPTQVTLFWEPIPLSEQNGVIRYYQIGVDGHNVRNVSPSPQHVNYTFDLKHLSPDQDYEVWIRAVTAAGPGENATTRFKTKNEIDVQMRILVWLLILLFIFGICPFISYFMFRRGQNKACPLLTHVLCHKVPDPRNSLIFRNMKHQINDPLAWLCKSAYEPHPKIAEVEIVESQSEAFKSPLNKTFILNTNITLMVGDGCSQMDCQDDLKEDVTTENCDRTDCRFERQEYSKMLDSDEEKDGEGEEDRNDCSNSSEEEEFTSGYEKHFMPTALEVLDIS